MIPLLPLFLHYLAELSYQFGVNRSFCHLWWWFTCRSSFNYNLFLYTGALIVMVLTADSFVAASDVDSRFITFSGSSMRGILVQYQMKYVASYTWNIRCSPVASRAFIFAVDLEKRWTIAYYHQIPIPSILEWKISLCFLLPFVLGHNVVLPHARPQNQSSVTPRAPFLVISSHVPDSIQLHDEYTSRQQSIIFNILHFSFFLVSLNCHHWSAKIDYQSYTCGGFVYREKRCWT